MKNEKTNYSSEQSTPETASSETLEKNLASGTPSMRDKTLKFYSFYTYKHYKINAPNPNIADYLYMPLFLYAGWHNDLNKALNHLIKKIKFETFNKNKEYTVTDLGFRHIECFYEENDIKTSKIIDMKNYGMIIKKCPKCKKEDYITNNNINYCLSCYNN